MKGRKILAVVCTLILLVSAFTGVFSFAAPDDTVYVKKHIGLVYDNSGSMSMDIEDVKNLKWTYASYAAQAFAGLLNDTDTLDITFMGDVNGSRSMTLDMAADRQKQVDKLLNATKDAEADTPWTAVTDAVQKLVKRGLLSDEQIGDNEVSQSEQFWLVLTTDGVFYKKTPEDTVNDIEQLLKTYSNLQIVYFGIGTTGDNSEYAANDLSNNSTLNSYPNFTAAFAEDQNQIVSTMQSLANRVSGRYGVTDGLKINGKTVTMRISGESSPIRNVAILAQETDAKLVSAKDSKGNSLKIARDARINYPHNDAYGNVAEGTKGGYIALITSDSGKVAPGTVTLTFSEDINADNFSLMYEPAVYVDITLETKDDNGDWVEIPYGQKIDGGRPVKVGYIVCEDGTDTPIDPAKLPGSSSVKLSIGDEEITVGDEFTIPAGSTAIKATVSLMDGAYTVSAVRNITVISLDGYTYEISDKLEFYPDEIATNTSKYIDFKVLYDGKTATADQVTEFSVDAGKLKGKLTTPKDGVFRFTPSHSECKVGKYPINLCFQGNTVATQNVVVKEEVISYTAKAGDGFSIFSNEIGDNKKPIVFTVTKHKGDDKLSLPKADADLFKVEATAANGETLSGKLKYVKGGKLEFTVKDKDAAVGVYSVKLYWEDKVIATSEINVLRYDATYTAKALIVGNGKVNRYDLFNNKSGVAFVIYMDGELCTKDQLESMINGGITIKSSPENKGAKLNASVGEYNGDPAIIVIPGSKAKNEFGAFMSGFGITWGNSVRGGDYKISLTVNAPKGTTATGTLDVFYNIVVSILWWLIPLIIFGIIGLVLWIIVCNIMMPRIAPGKIRHYYLTPSTDEKYNVTSDEYSHKWKFYVRLLPLPEKFNFKGLDFSASKEKFCKTFPIALLNKNLRELKQFYKKSSMSRSTRELIENLERSRNKISANKLGLVLNVSGQSIAKDIKDKDEQKIHDKKQTLESGTILYQKKMSREKVSGIHIWVYTSN